MEPVTHKGLHKYLLGDRMQFDACWPTGDTNIVKIFDQNQ